MRECDSTFGFRMPFFGPFQIADMAGLDVWESAAGTMERAYGERFRMPQILHEKTAGHHVSNLLGKLGVANRLEAAALAHRVGVGDPSPP